MRPILRQVFCVLLAIHGLANSQEQPVAQDSTPPLVNFQLPLELGGYFTFDAATPLSSWAKLDIPYQLSWMELTAQAPISENVTGAITLLSTGDLEKLRIWQCMAAWQMGDWSLSGGQQNFHFGLFTTRTVSGPLIWDSAWRNAAGSEIGWKQSDVMKVGIGFASLLNGADSAAGREETHDPTMTGYLDWTPREGNDFRFSGLANAHF